MLKGLLEKKAKLGAEIRRMADLVGKDKRSFTAEEQCAWEKVNADYNEVEKQVSVENRSIEIAKSMDAQTAVMDGNPEVRRDPEEDNSNALKAWLAAGSSARVSAECRDAASAKKIDLSVKEMLLTMPKRLERSESAREKRALSAITGGSGGFMVPTGFINNFEKAMLYFGGILNVADVMRTDSGADLPWPGFDDTTNTGEIIGENADHGTATNPAYKQLVFKAYEFSSKILKVPISLFEDSAFDLNTQIAEALGQRVGRIANTRMTTGTGNGMPNGIVTASTLGKTATSSTAISVDDLLELTHSVDVAYRNDPSFGYMMHDNVILALRKLKYGDGTYIWQQNIRDGAPDRLLGKPLTINNDMDSTIASTKKSILCGAMRYYKVRQVRDLSLVRLNERYAEYRQVAFLVVQRMDGNLLDMGTHPIKHMYHT